MGGAGVLGNAVRLNPLYDDFALFDMYMSSLDVVLADPEIRAALDEFRLSPTRSVRAWSPTLVRF